MTRYTVTEDTVFEQNTITADHFGVNLVTIYDEEFVDPADSLSSNVSALGATTLRFPGGSATENFFDMTQPNLAVSARDPSQTLTPMDAFFAEAGRIEIDVALVIPTQQAFALSAAEAMLAGSYGTRSDFAPDYLDDVRAYVAEAISYANANGVTIKSFEIGNEFWGSGAMAAAEYGHVAGAVASLLAQELPALDYGEAKVIVQATSAASQLYSPRDDTAAFVGEVDGVLMAFSQGQIDSLYGGTAPQGFQTVIVPGQGTPRDQLLDIANGINAEPGAATAIDGLVQHYYQTSGIDGVDGDKSFKFDQFDRMAEWLERPADAADLTYHITEWNTKSNGAANNRGLQNAQMIVEHFFELAINDIDAAQIWPLSFDSAQGTSMVDVDGNDLAINGEMFRLMSESLQGLTPVLDWDVSGTIDVHGYGSGDRLVLFVSERSGDDQSGVTLDLSQFLSGGQYFVTSTELWDGGAGGANAAAEPVVTTIDGRMSGATEVSFSLGAWAIRRIEFSLSDDSENEINGRDGEDIIDGDGGADRIRGGDGADVIDGGAGDDFIFGDGGDDRLLGSAGDDDLFGRAGNDQLFGRSGDDDLYGEGGDDYLVGGSGSDALFGNEGSDLLFGENGIVARDAFAAQAYRLYQATLGRAPDENGHTAWTNALANGQISLQQAATGFVSSAEFQQKYGATSNGQFVTLLYNNVLERAPDFSGFNTWVSALDSGGLARAEVVAGFSESAEFVNNTSLGAQRFFTDVSQANFTDEVYRMYRSTLDRNPDAGGLFNWTSALANGQLTLQQAVSGFVNSAEFQQKYGATDNGQFVGLLYDNVLDRAPDAGGFTAWTSALNAGSLTRSDVVLRFSESAEFVRKAAPGLDAFMKSGAAAGLGDHLAGGSGNDLLVGGIGADVFVFDADESFDTVIVDFEDWDTIQIENSSFTNMDQLALSQVGDDVMFTGAGQRVTLLDTQISDLVDDNFNFV